MWNNQRSQNVPQFKFWSMIIELELLMTRFVRSLREGDFPLYVQSCDELCSWFHALDHTNYARWLPVHVRDMVQLAQQNPEVHAEFMKGNSVVQKSRRKFSLMAKGKPMSSQIRHSRRKAEHLDFMGTTRHLCCSC